MKNLIKTYNNLLFEWMNLGLQSLSNFPKSYKLGLYYFRINQGHANEKDYFRLFTNECGETLAYQILDEACSQILINFQSLLQKPIKLLKFNCLVKIYLTELDNLYFNIVIGFTAKNSAFLYTIIDINRIKYEKLSKLQFRYDRNNQLNYIITLHDF